MTEETKQPSPRDYWKDFPEAPYSDTFKWVSAEGFEHMSTVRAWSFTLLIKAVADAEQMIGLNSGKPAGGKMAIPQSTIPVTDETGVPVVDGNTGKPAMTTLPEGVALYTVAGLVHDKNKDGTKDLLKVFTVEAPYNKGYGVTCFHPHADLKGFTSWAVTSKENKAMYAPPESCKHALIRAPKEEGKYPDVLEFRP